MRIDLREPAVVLVAVVVAVVVRVLEAPAPVRPAVLGVFLLVCPGAALVGNPSTWSGLAWLTAALSASIASSILVSCGLLYAGAWTPDRTLGVLAVVSAVGCLAHLALRSRGARA